MEKYNAEPDDEGRVAIGVSYDSTWMTWKHKSHISVSFIMEIQTGTAVDMMVIFNYSPSCKEDKTLKRHICQRNFWGNSGAMETEETMQLWSHSTTQQLKYVTFIGDGDSSAYKAVCQVIDGHGPYNVPVQGCQNGWKQGCKSWRRRPASTSQYSGKRMRRNTLDSAHILRDDSRQTPVNMARYFQGNIYKEVRGCCNLLPFHFVSQ